MPRPLARFLPAAQLAASFPGPGGLFRPERGRGARTRPCRRPTCAGGRVPYWAKTAANSDRSSRCFHIPITIFIASRSRWRTWLTASALRPTFTPARRFWRIIASMTEALADLPTLGLLRGEGPTRSRPVLGLPGQKPERLPTSCRAAELFRVLQAGGDPSKVVFSGVGKTGDEVNTRWPAGFYSFKLANRNRRLALIVSPWPRGGE